MVCVSILPSDPDALEIALHSAPVTAVQLVAQEEPSRLLLLSASRDGTVRQCLCLVFFPLPSRLKTPPLPCGDRSQVCVWNITERKLLATSRHHSQAVTAICLPPGQDLLRSGRSELAATRLLGPHFVSVGADCTGAQRNASSFRTAFPCVFTF